MGVLLRARTGAVWAGLLCLATTGAFAVLPTGAGAAAPRAVALQTPLPPPEDMNSDETTPIAIYTAATRPLLPRYGAMAGAIRPLATQPRPAIPKNAADTWALLIGLHAVANAAYERLLQARSDPAFTLVPPGPQQDPANQLPRFRHSRTFTEDVGFPLLELYTGEAHDAEFAVRFMQAIERARAARAAGATAIETKQITRAVDLAFQLSEALGFLTNGRKHLPPEWGNALLPEPPLTPAAVTRFRRLVPTIAARLRALGYPPDLVQVAVSELTAPPATAIRGPLFAPFDNLTYRRQEIHVQEVVNGFAQRGRF